MFRKYLTQNGTFFLLQKNESGTITSYIDSQQNCNFDRTQVQ